MQLIKKNMNWVMWLSALTGLLAICTAFAQNFKDKKDNDQRIADKDEIIKLQKVNSDKLQEINNLQTQIIISSNKLVEANERIVSLNIELSKYLSGGDSYPFVDAVRFLNEEGKYRFSLMINQVGKYPLYDVKVSYWNPDEIQAMARPDGIATSEILKRYNNFDVGDISQKGSQSFGHSFTIDEDGVKKINLSIVTKNGSFSEILRISKNGNVFSYAYKVNTVTDGKTKPKVLKKRVDENFPKTPNGEAKWE